MTFIQASLADSIGSVTWIGTTADTTTNVNLRGMSGSSTLRWVVALGFWSEMDGGGGIFEWDPTAIGTDDGGTVIVPSAGGSATGCWRRVYSGPMDVRWFGCKCDGTTDDAARLQMALDAVPSGGQLVISGLMAVGSPDWAGLLIHGKTALSLIGLHDSCGIKVLYAPTQQVRGGEPPGAFVLQACARVQIRGILFDGNGVGSNFTALYLDFLADSIVTDCVFKNMTFTGSGAGLVSWAGTNNIYRGNRIRNCFQGFAVGMSSGYPGGPTLMETNANITGNSFANCVGDSALWISAEHCLVANNVFSGGTHGININSNLGYPTHDLVITGNTFNSNAGCGIRMDHDGRGAQEVRNFIISNNTIEGCGQFPIQIVAVDTITIVGNQVINNTYPLGMLGGKNVTISDNVVMDTRSPPVSQLGIDLFGIETATISNNTVRFGTGSYPSCVGIRVYPTSDTVPSTNISITNNIVSDFDCGIWTFSAVNVNLAGNQVRSSRVGLVMGSCDGVEVANNAIRCQYGVYGTACSKVFMEGNVFVSSTGPDIDITLTAGEVLHSTGDAYATAKCNSYIVAIEGHMGRMQQHMHDTGPPTATSVSWNVGDIVYNTTPTAGGYIGWVCTAAGSPGTWHSFGLI